MNICMLLAALLVVTSITAESTSVDSSNPPKPPCRCRHKTTSTTTSTTTTTTTTTTTPKPTKAPCNVQKVTYHIFHQEMNRPAAIAACRARGMRIADISSLREQAAVDQVLRIFRPTLNHGFWFMNWFMHNGRTAYKNWAPGFPVKNRACVQLFRYNNQIKWSNLLCADKRRYICQTVPKC